jgi:NAD+ diphosphatase
VESVSDFWPNHVPPTDTDTEALWICVRGRDVLLGPPDELDLPVRSRHFMGMLGPVACWAAEISDDDATVDAALFVDLYRAYGQFDERTWTLAGRAVQLVDWERTHQFCGRCGTPTRMSETDRSRQCPSCGQLAYPRLAPAVITLVERDDEVLLARGNNFNVPMYSCIAGFVEPGETLEEAVEREILEEVGVKVGNVRYRQSQPWPFPHSLMLGFWATWESGDIKIDPSEITDAQWFSRHELPMVPGAISIAGRLIEDWRAGK